MLANRKQILPYFMKVDCTRLLVQNGSVGQTQGGTEQIPSKSGSNKHQIGLGRFVKATSFPHNCSFKLLSDNGHERVEDGRFLEAIGRSDIPDGNTNPLNVRKMSFSIRVQPL